MKSLKGGTIFLGKGPVITSGLNYVGVSLLTEGFFIILLNHNQNQIKSNLFKVSKKHAIQSKISSLDQILEAKQSLSLVFERIPTI